MISPQVALGDWSVYNFLDSISVVSKILCVQVCRYRISIVSTASYELGDDLAVYFRSFNEGACVKLVDNIFRKCIMCCKVTLCMIVVCR